MNEKDLMQMRLIKNFLQRKLYFKEDRLSITQEYTKRYKLKKDINKIKRYINNLENKILQK